MSFSSIEFIIFFILVLLISFLLQHFHLKKIKEIFLLFASYFFYGYWDWRFCFLLLFMTLIAYLSAKHSDNKLLYIIGIAVPLCTLALFKYFNFFLDSFSSILNKNLGSLKIILPVGISFYTFQSLSYVIDVHRGKLEPAKNFVKLALYISFFPQLVAGPIIKASDFLPQLDEDRNINVSNLAYGVQLFLFGLFKKIVIADHLSVFVDNVYAFPEIYHYTTIILAIVSYSIQIYFDFSGYSDMAIGCAKCLGYDFKNNFNLPYISQTVTEFWRRWHISLSTWLKEYLYIPLGGNRKGKFRQYINLFLTMLLGGLWHGANWTFVLWGAINGLALCVDKFFIHGKNNSICQYLSVFITFIFITFTWVFFRSSSFSEVLTIFKAIFTLQSGIRQNFSWSFVAIVILTISTIFAIIKTKTNDLSNVSGFYPIFDLKSIKGLTLLFIFIGLILILAYTGENPFVYFQF